MRCALAGGCAMNSVANGKVYARSPFQRLYVQSAAGDAGGAIGAAIVVWQRMRDGAAARRARRWTTPTAGRSIPMRRSVPLIDARRAEIEAQACAR